MDFSNLELEEWLEETKKLNLSLERLITHISNPSTCHYTKVFNKLRGNIIKDKAEILFKEFNKSVTPTDKVKYVLTTSEEAVFVSSVVESVSISFLNVEDNKILPLPKSIESIKTKLN